MTTSALPLPAGTAPPGRPAWRTLVPVSIVVGLAHLALLGWMPAGVGPEPPALANKFVTRTIVIAPAALAPAARPPPKPPGPKAGHARPAPKPAPAPAEPSTAMTQAPPEADARALAADAAPSAADAGSAEAPAPAASAASAPAAASAAEGPVPLRVPGSVRLKFAVTGQQGAAPMGGVFGELAWLQDGQAYDARLSLSILFKTLRTQHSSGVIGPSGIEPARFSDTRKTEVASHFVRDQGQVVFSSNAPSVPLLPGAQDRLSVMIQLGALLAGDPARYPADGAIAVQTVGPRDADIWIFKIGEEEQLHLPAGDFAARKLTRNARRPYDDIVELWLAPALDYLPVRFKLTQSNGDFADMQLRERLPLSGSN
jgi:hypothetical protein